MRLLLDEHLSPSLAQQLRLRGIDAVTLGRTDLGALDDVVLARALSDNRVLVTYDQQTVPGLLREWAQAGRHHAGVIFIDEKTIRQDDIGSQLSALEQFVTHHKEEDWTDKVVYLLRPAR